ncbi:MAG: nitroreductase family deazaflavin-dependent oxidoreductase [Anaerolineae bacterium]|nr:nitroreductase family deazaflavin-dependent oxidoreductase [Anaerolineae bacterium]
MLQTFIIRLLNVVVTFLLRSPWHRFISKDMLLIQFTGRKSGKVYTTPVSYMWDDDVVKIFTDLQGKWWKNLQNKAPVRLWLQGNEVHGTAEAVTERVKLISEVKDFLERVPRDTRAYGVKLDQNGKMTLEAAEQAAIDTVMIQIQLG